LIFFDIKWLVNVQGMKRNEKEESEMSDKTRKINPERRSHQST
jgi:hypothetical protein